MPLPLLCYPQWSSFASDVRTRTFSEGRELIRHQDISVPLIPCPSLTIYTLRRVLLLQWNHTNTSLAQWCGQSLSVSMWVFYDVCSVLCVCVCISQPRGYLERSLGFFCSVWSTNRSPPFAQVCFALTAMLHFLCSSLIWRQPHHSLVRCMRHDYAVTPVSVSQPLMQETSEVLSETLLGNKN